QAEAIEFVLAHERHLLLVGPTAMGKTLAYMLPAANRDHGITCVLLPLSALHTDFDRRCTDLKIESSRWTPQNDRPRTKIIYVSPEHAQTKRFNDHVFELHRLGLLKQFVIDEVHLVKSHSDFRFCFSALKPLLSCGVPFLLMTATCPLPLRSEILGALGISDCHIIHAPTDRPEISYRVDISPTLDEAKEKLVVAVEDRLAKTKSTSFRGLVYCRSKKDVDEIAERLGCDAFHAGRPVEERKASFQNWVNGKKKFIICSSLLGCGIDIEGVAVVFHFGTPWSILDFAQESGRAGRGGKASISVV
ncbi:P-loop containing nucleoside triphosphate hydrolase protein, partial [Thelephora terrestris]